MTKNYPIQDKRWQRLLCFWTLLIPILGLAQSGATVTWNSQVACIDYGSEGDINENVVIWEDIEQSACIRVCENSTVQYTVTGLNIQNVQWSVSGGTLQTGGAQPQMNRTVTWWNAGNGALTITITYSNGTQSTAKLCFEKIQGPNPDFQIAGGGQLVVCKNTPVYFDNLTTNGGGTSILHYLWDFGDGTPQSSLFEPVHTFTQAGVYKVTLSATNECNCTNLRSYDIVVLESNPVNISCKSVVCEGSIETYTANDPCGGDWDVIGGTIVSQSGTQIEVKWDQVDPADGFGYVKYLSSCGCPQWTTIQIPVVLSTIELKGEGVICTEKQYKYTLPQWPTTAVLWSASDPNVQLNYTPNRNEVLVRSYQSGTFTLTANYHNTLLGCKGETSLQITATDPTTVTGGADQVCTGSALTFTGNPGGTPLNWSVVFNNNIQNFNNISGAFNYTFANPGTYAIYVSQTGGCVGVPKIVKAIQLPAIPSGTISGPDKVCLGIPYTYTLSTVDSGVIPVWEVTGGTIQGSNTGLSVTIIFNAGTSPYTVSVRNRTLDQLGCLSSPKNITVQAIVLNATITPINPPSSGVYCPSSTAEFTADFGGVTPDLITWSFQNPNFGSIVGGQGTNSITVNFNEIPSFGGSPNSNLVVEIKKCNQTQTFNIPITLQPLPTLNFVSNNALCLGGTLTFQVNTGGVTSAGNMVFTFPNGTPHSMPYQPSGVYTFPNNGYLQNNTGASIIQSITATLYSPNGCNYQPSITANIEVLPLTEITVTPENYYTICNINNYNPINLHSNVSTGITTSVSFQWYHNNTPIAGATTPDYTISGSSPSPLGTYYVEVVDQYGCTVKSQNILVSNNNCNPVGVACTIGFDPNLQVNGSWATCSTINTTVTYAGTPSSISWSGSSFNPIVSGQGTANATFAPSVPGVHAVTAILTYGNCLVQKTYEVVTNYQAKFTSKRGCTANNNNTWDISLINNSVIYDIDPATLTYTYELNGVTLSGVNMQFAYFTNLLPGTYTATLTISAPGLPPCTKTEIIVLDPLPNVDFNLSTQYCAGEVINLVIPTYNPQYSYSWTYTVNNVSNTILATSSTTQISIPDYIGSVDVSLLANVPFACSYELTKSTLINKANFTGTLNLNISDYCEGSNPVPVLTFNSGFGSLQPVNYYWMNGPQEVGVTSTNTYSPTQSGSYWVILEDVNGCKDTKLVNNQELFTFRPKPYANISAKQQICLGSSAILYGIVTDNTLEHRWLMNGNPVSGAAGTWSTSQTTLSHTANGLAVGNYSFVFEVRPPNNPGCGNSATFNVTVSNPPNVPVIDMNIQCADPNTSPATPYTVVLSIQNPQAGQYNWSNGQSGTAIHVNHGGIYQVTYTAPSGCAVSNQTMVPHDLESLMWIFPTGCYDVCLSDGYLVGPLGDYANHEWQFFGNNQQGSGGFIYPFWPSQQGNYQLMLDNGYCQFTSGVMTLNPDPEKCDVTYECKIRGHIEMVEKGDGYYMIFGIINNYSSTSVTLSITSANGYGVYYPNNITIAPGGSFDFMTNPILFYPIQGFNGGNDTILFTGINCEFKYELDFPNLYRMANPEIMIAKSKIIIAPNPAKGMVKVSYTTGDKKYPASMLLVHDALGNVKYRKNLNASEGEEQFDTSQWLQGVYIITVVSPEKPLQGKLLKE